MIIVLISVDNFGQCN